MITHCLSSFRMNRLAWRVSATLCFALSDSNPAWAQTLNPPCTSFFQPFDACFERAGQLMVQGQLPQAQAIYQIADSAIDALPPHLQAATALNLARIARWQGQYSQAQLRYAAFLQNQPSSTEAMIGLGLIALEEKRFDESSAYLTKAQQLGDTSEELVLARQWLSTAWKYQLTIGAQGLHSPAGSSQLPVFTLEYALNGALTARVGLRALETNRSDTNRLNDFSGQARVLALGAVYRPNAANTIDVQYDKTIQATGDARDDKALKISYELKQAPLQAALYFQANRQNGLDNRELRGNVTAPINTRLALLLAANSVQVNTQYANKHGQIGMRYAVTENTYWQAALRQSSTQFNNNSHTQHTALLLETGTKPSQNHALRLSLLADSLANKRQVNAAWRYDGQPAIELRHEWIQETAASARVLQNNTTADVNLALSPMLDLKLSVSHQSLAKSNSALGLLVYRWK